MNTPLLKSAAAAALALAAGTLSAQSATIDFIPSPMETGGMVMPMVKIDSASSSISIGMMGQPTSITIYRLQEWVVDGGTPFANDVFDPAKSGEEWYGLLDPTQQHLPFSTNYGFMLHDSVASDLPTGSFLYIQATNVTAGLNGYGFGSYDEAYGDDNPSTLLHVFGEESAFNNLAVWGDASGISMWHPLFVTDTFGTFSADFEIYVGDGFGIPLDGWTSDTIHLEWVAVPEPSTYALLGIAAAAGLIQWRRKRFA